MTDDGPDPTPPAHCRVEPTTEDRWRRTGLLLLLPDLMVSGAWPALWQRLTALDVHAVAVTATKLSPATMARLYAGSTVKPQNGRRPATSLGWRIGTLDMSIPVVLRTPYEVDLNRVLDRWKGASAYGRRGPGDLREVWPAANRCMSLVHSPDDTDQLWRDLRMLFGDRTAERLRTGPDTPPLPPDCVAWLRMYRPLADERHPYDIVLRTMIRGLTLLAYDARGAGLLRDDLDGLIRTLLALRSTLDRTAADPERRGDLLPLLSEGLAGAHGPLAAAALRLGAGDTGGHERVWLARRVALAGALDLLADPDGWCEQLAVEVTEVLDVNALVTDRWEQHLLGCALAFAPRG